MIAPPMNSTNRLIQSTSSTTRNNPAIVDNSQTVEVSFCSSMKVKKNGPQ